MNTNVLTEWLPPAAAARRLGLSTDRVRQLVSAGQLVSIRTPLGHLIEARDVERLRERRLTDAEIASAAKREES